MHELSRVPCFDDKFVVQQRQLEGAPLDASDKHFRASLKSAEVAEKLEALEDAPMEVSEGSQAIYKHGQRGRLVWLLLRASAALVSRSARWQRQRAGQSCTG